MAAQGFLLIASFLLVLFVIARPLGFGLARLINNTSLPGLTGIGSLFWRGLGISQQEMNWRQYLLAILALNVLGLLVTVFDADGAKPAAVKSSATAAGDFRGIWRLTLRGKFLSY